MMVDSYMGPGVRRRFRRPVVLLVVASVLLVTASVLLFVRPPADTPTRADAIFVLSGDRGERMAAALRFADRYPGATLVHVGTPDSIFVRRLCAGLEGRDAVCLAPKPDNTRTEARAIAQLTRERGWTRPVVVTSTYHVTRSRLLVARCLDRGFETVAARPRIRWWQWIPQIAHEWGGLAQALVLRRGC